jgi:hypothetical protein
MFHDPAAETRQNRRRITKASARLRMIFAKRVFFWSGVYGVLALLPLYFLEGKIGRDYPPATNHPEQYYVLIGVALAWQVAFLLISRDPVRFRPLMIPAIAEKFLSVGAVILLYMGDRISGTVMAPFLGDAVLGGLFIASYLKTAKYAAP